MKIWEPTLEEKVIDMSKPKKRVKASTKSKTPSLIMWRGFAILSPSGMFLEGRATRLEALKSAPKSSRLVLVTARLERVTRRQIIESREEDLGILSPEEFVDG